MQDMKQRMLGEIDSRIQRLYEHKDDEKRDFGNQYAKLNHAISDVIGHSLTCELESLRSFVEEL